MIEIVICDLDGTIADCSHRQHHVQGEGKKNWRAFFREMDKDVLNVKLNRVLEALWYDNMEIWFVSARPDDYREVTEEWLRKAGWIVGDNCKLLMRKAGDYRADTIVKKEILDQIRSEDVDVVIAFDDRTSVVEMWRENDILCAQVAQHDF